MWLNIPFENGTATNNQNRREDRACNKSAFVASLIKRALCSNEISIEYIVFPMSMTITKRVDVLH